jgi:antitoxin (DNA-binding transcriptional repressor) of toxin-antitoxin stability system
MKVTASKLRQDIYNILDNVLNTGTPVEIERKGKTLKIVAVDAPHASKLARLVPHPEALVGDPEDLVHLDWSGEWKP